MKRWIYLIKSQKDDLEYYKIGFTKKEPNLRLKQLQTGNPLRLELVSCFETKYYTMMETTIHRIYELERERSDGEWFNLSKEHVKDFLNLCEKLEHNFDFLKENSSLKKLK